MGSLKSAKDIPLSQSRSDHNIGSLFGSGERSDFNDPRARAADGKGITNGKVVELDLTKNPKAKFDLEAHLRRITINHIADRKRNLFVSLSDDDFQIGSVRLKVPPVDINITDTRQFDITSSARTNRVYAVRSGHGLLQIDLTLVMSGKDTINKELREILGYFKMGPFITIRSRYLFRTMLIAAAQDTVILGNIGPVEKTLLQSFYQARDDMFSAERSLNRMKLQSILKNFRIVTLKSDENRDITEEDISGILEVAAGKFANTVLNNNHRDLLNAPTLGTTYAETVFELMNIARRRSTDTIIQWLRDNILIRSDSLDSAISELSTYSDVKHAEIEMRQLVKNFINAERVLFDKVFIDSSSFDNSKFFDDQEPIPVAIKSISYRTDDDPEVLIVDISLYLFNHTPYVPRFMWKDQVGNPTLFIEEAAWYNRQLDIQYLNPKFILPEFKPVAKQKLPADVLSGVNVYELTEVTNSQASYKNSLPVGAFTNNEEFEIFYPLSGQSVGTSIRKNFYERFVVVDSEQTPKEKRVQEESVVMSAFSATHRHKLVVQPTQAGHYATLQYVGGRESIHQVEFLIKGTKTISTFNRIREEIDKASYVTLANRKENVALFINNELMNLFGSSQFQIIDYQIKPIDPDTSIVSLSLVDQTPRPPVRIRQNIQGQSYIAGATSRLQFLAGEGHTQIKALVKIDVKTTRRDQAGGGIFSKIENVRKKIGEATPEERAEAKAATKVLYDRDAGFFNQTVLIATILNDSSFSELFTKRIKHSNVPTNTNALRVNLQKILHEASVIKASDFAKKQLQQFRIVDAEGYDDSIARYKLEGFLGQLARSQTRTIHRPGAFPIRTGHIKWVVAVLIADLAYRIVLSGGGKYTVESIEIPKPKKKDLVGSWEGQEFINDIFNIVRLYVTLMTGNSFNSTTTHLVTKLHDFYPALFFQLVDEAQELRRVDLQQLRRVDLQGSKSIPEDTQKIPHFTPNRRTNAIDPYPDLQLPTYAEAMSITEVLYLTMIQDPENTAILKRFIPSHRHFGLKAPVGVSQQALSRVASDLVEPDFWWFQWDSSRELIDPVLETIEKGNPVAQRAWSINSSMNGLPAEIPVELLEIIDGDTIRVNFKNATHLPYLNIRHDSDLSDSVRQTILTNGEQGVKGSGYRIRLTNFNAPEAFRKRTFGKEIVGANTKSYDEARASIITLLIHLNLARNEIDAERHFKRSDNGLTNISFKQRTVYLSDFTGQDKYGRYLFAVKPIASTPAGANAQSLNTAGYKGMSIDTPNSTQEEAQLAKAVAFDRVLTTAEPRRMAYAFPTVSIKFIFEGKLKPLLDVETLEEGREAAAEALAKKEAESFRADVFIDAPITSVSILQRAKKIKVAQIQLSEYADAFTNDRFFLFPQDEDYSIFELGGSLTNSNGTAQLRDAIARVRPKNVISPGAISSGKDTDLLLTSAGERIKEEASKNKYWLRDKILREGTRITIRIGYSSNIDALPIRFTGIIVEKNRGDQLVMVAQSYDAQLLQPIVGTDFSPSGDKDILAKTLRGIFEYWDKNGGTRFLGGFKNNLLNYIKIGALEYSNLLDLAPGQDSLSEAFSKISKKGINQRLAVKSRALTNDIQFSNQGDGDQLRFDVMNRINVTSTIAERIVKELDNTTPSKQGLNIVSKSLFEPIKGLVSDIIGLVLEDPHGELINCFVPWETFWAKVGNSISIEGDAEVKSKSRTVHAILDEIMHWFPEYIWYFDYFDDEMRLFIGRPTQRYITTAKIQGEEDDLKYYFRSAKPRVQFAQSMHGLWNWFVRWMKSKSLIGRGDIGALVLFGPVLTSLATTPDRDAFFKPLAPATARLLIPSFRAIGSILGIKPRSDQNDVNIRLEIRAELGESLNEERSYLLEHLGEEGLRGFMKHVFSIFSDADADGRRIQEKDFSSGSLVGPSNLSILADLSNFDEIIINNNLLWGSIIDGIKEADVAAAFRVTVEPNSLERTSVEVYVANGTFRTIYNQSIDEDLIKRLINTFIINLGFFRLIIKGFVNWLRTTTGEDALEIRDNLNSINNFSKWLAHPRQKVFRDEISVTSFDGIISNDIKASTSHMYNGVTLGYDGDHIQKRWISVVPEDRRILHITEPHLVNDDLAAQSAQSWLAEGLSNMYQGELVLRGRPLKPFDLVYINDSYNGLYGPIEVGEITEIFNVADGYISVIQPKLYTVAQTLGEDWGYVAAQQRTTALLTLFTIASIGAVFVPGLNLFVAASFGLAAAGISTFKEEITTLHAGRDSPNSPQDPTKQIDHFSQQLQKRFVSGLGKLRAREPDPERDLHFAASGVTIYPLIQYGGIPKPFIAGLKGTPVTQWHISDTVRGLTNWIDQYLDDVVTGLESDASFKKASEVLQGFGQTRALVEFAALTNPKSLTDLLD